MSEPRYPFLHVEVDADEDELVSDTLWALGATGVEERDASTMPPVGEAPVPAGKALLVASFPGEAEAQEALAHLGREGVLKFVVGDDWRENWRAWFKPTPLGERILIRPSWEEITETDRVVLTIDPGGAFGTGLHETTRLCLRDIEKSIQGGERVLDLGCGSGILSVAAMLFGAESAVGVDIEEAAVETTLENAEVNGVTLRASTTPIEEVAGTYERVFANIQAPILIPRAAAIAAKVAPGGRLVLSGVLQEQEAEVRAVYLETGLRHLESPVDGAWVALVFEQPAPPES